MGKCERCGKKRKALFMIVAKNGAMVILFVCNKCLEEVEKDE